MGQAGHSLSLRHAHSNTHALEPSVERAPSLSLSLSASVPSSLRNYGFRLSTIFAFFVVAMIFPRCSATTSICLSNTIGDGLARNFTVFSKACSYCSCYRCAPTSLPQCDMKRCL